MRNKIIVGNNGRLYIKEIQQVKSYELSCSGCCFMKLDCLLTRVRIFGDKYDSSVYSCYCRKIIFKDVTDGV